MHGMGVASHGRDPGLNRGPNVMKRLLQSPGDEGLSFREALVFSVGFASDFVPGKAQRRLVEKKGPIGPLTKQKMRIETCESWTAAVRLPHFFWVYDKQDLCQVNEFSHL